MSRRVVTLIATAIGLALLAAAIKKTGLDEIVDGLRRIGVPGMALILGASLVRQVARAQAWTLLMSGDGSTSAPPLSSALAATIGGDAIGNLTPLSLIVSEPAKAMYVSAHVPAPRALAALAAENFFYSLSVAIAVLFGVAVLFVAFPAVPEELRTLSLVIVAGMTAVLVGALWLIAKEPALVSATLGRFVSPRILGKIRDLETSSYALVRAHPARLAGVIACEVTFHVFSIAETWITLVFLGIHSLPLAIVLDTVQRVINVIFRVVPLKIGVDEVGSGFITEALNFGHPLGVTMAVIRKVRVLAWASVGLLILSAHKGEVRK